MKIEKVDINSLKLDKNNPRQHNSKNLDVVAKSIENFGQYKPLIVQKSTNIILVGNGRYSAMKDLGFTEVNVVFVDVDDKKANLLKIADNRTSELSSWDENNLIKELETFDETLLDLTGFSQEDILDMKELKIENEETKKMKVKKCQCPECGFEFEK